MIQIHPTNLWRRIKISNIQIQIISSDSNFGGYGGEVKTRPRQMPVTLERRKIYLMIKCFQLSGVNGVTIILDKTPTRHNSSEISNQPASGGQRKTFSFENEGQDSLLVQSGVVGHCQLKCHFSNLSQNFTFLYNQRADAKATPDRPTYFKNTNKTELQFSCCKAKRGNKKSVFSAGNISIK